VGSISTLQSICPDGSGALEAKSHIAEVLDIPIDGAGCMNERVCGGAARPRTAAAG